LLMATGTQNDDLRADELHDRQLPVLTPTIGSQIHSLSLVRAHDVFLYHLRDHADRVRLHTLELEGDFDDGIAFYKCIPQLVSLRKLKLFPSDLCDRNEYWIFRGLRENGSIVEVETEEDGRSAFSAAQLRLIDAYCQRNRMLNELVVGSEQRSAERGGEHNDNGIDIGNTVDGDVKDHGVSDDGTDNTVNAAHRTVKAELLHRPSMFQCAEQIPRTHATMLIRGLAVLGDGIGF
jgi:hypothetical protein